MHLAFTLILTLLASSDVTPPAGPPVAVRMIDLDGNGQLDQLRTEADGSLSVYVHDGGRSYSRVDQALPTVVVADLLVDDLNSDGLLDLYVVSPGENLALIGTGGGRFADATERLGLTEAGPGLSAEHIDLDDDGRQDVLVHNTDTDVVFWAQPFGRYERDGGMPGGEASSVSPVAAALGLTDADLTAMGVDVAQIEAALLSAATGGRLGGGPVGGPTYASGGGDGTPTAHDIFAVVSLDDFVTALEARYVNENSNEVGTGDIADGSLLGADVSTSSGDVTHMGGNVGLGVAVPVARLDVGGDVAIDGTVVINSLRQWVGDPSGLAGATGPVGPAGATGPAGAAGATGLAGASGPAGAAGATGPAGPAGATGVAGANGAAGATGATGAAGTAGTDGPHTGGVNNTYSSPAFVGGGENNAANGNKSTVAGGFSNTANGGYTTVGGGAGNTAGQAGVIAGGLGNQALGASSAVGGGYVNNASGSFAAIGGGRGNTAGIYGAVGGGTNNEASGTGAVIAGGYGNSTSGLGPTVAGGYNNQALGDSATVAGGGNNTASANFSTVGGGNTNTASALSATVAGGGNNIASANLSAVGGGGNNTATSLSATVPGGDSNDATASYSFAAGRLSKASHDGAFVWGDSQSAVTKGSSGPDSFNVYASGGTTIYSNSAATTGVTLAAGGGSWSALSDQASKENVEPVDGRDVLQRLAALPISTWNYIAQEDDVRHMGPMAQDFRAAFGLGVSDRLIDTIDPDGVALAAIQALHALAVERQAEIDALRAEVEALKEQIATER